MNWLNSKFNRAHTIKLHFDGKWSELTIFYNKNNLYTSFNLDQSTYERTKRKDGGCSSGVFFDLSKSLFCKTFLDVKNFYTSNLDAKNQFNTILAQHRDIVSCELNETIVLEKQKVTWSKIPQDSSLNIHVFRLALYEDLFYYVLAERQYVDTILGKKIVRTSALQVETEEARKYINQASSKFSTSISLKQQSCEDALRSVFTDDKQNNNAKKIERCGVL